MLPGEEVDYVKCRVWAKLWLNRALPKSNVIFGEVPFFLTHRMCHELISGFYNQSIVSLSSNLLPNAFRFLS